MDILVFLWETRLIIERLRKLDGYYKVLICDKRSYSEKEYLDSCIDEIIEVPDIYDKSILEMKFREIIQKGRIVALYPTFESTVEIAGYLRDKFDIPGMKEIECINSRDKFLMKKTVSDAGVKTSDVGIVKCINNITEFARDHGYPVIVKPIDGFGTMSTTIINSREDLLEKQDRLFNVNNLLSKFKGWIVESFIRGQEYHCDSIVVNNRVVFSSVSKYHHNCIDVVNSDKPLGSIILPEGSEFQNIINKINSVNREVVSALNITNSVCHLEVFYDEQYDNVYFGEIAARIGGAPLTGPCIKNTYNVDIYKAFIEAGIGKFGQEYLKQDLVFTGFISFPSAVGKIIHISSEDDFRNIEGVVEVSIYNKVGDYLYGKDNATVRTGHIVMQDKGYEQLKQKLYSAYNHFELLVN